MSRLILSLALLSLPLLAQQVTVQWPEFSLPKVEAGSPPFPGLTTVLGNGAATPFTVTASGSFLRLKTSSGIAPAAGSTRVEFDLVFDGLPVGTQLQGSVTILPQGQSAIVVPVTAAIVSMGWDFIPSSQLLQLTAAADGSVTGSFGLRFIRDARVFVQSLANGIPFDPVLIQNEAHPAGYVRTVPVTARMAVSPPGRYTSDYLVIPSDINHYPLRFMKVEVTVPGLTLSPGQGHIIVQGAPPLPVPVGLNNVGPSVPYTLTTSQPWMRVSPASGTLPADGAASSTLTIDVTGLAPGRYEGTLRASAPGRKDAASTYTVNVSAVTLLSSLSQFNLSGFTLGYPAAFQSATIITNSPSHIPYNVTTSNPWISVSASTQYIHASTPGSIRVGYVGGMLPAGIHRGSVTVSAPPAPPLVIPVVANLTEAFLSASPSAISLRGAPPATLTASFQATFSMPSTLSVAASSQNGWLSVDAPSHQTSPATVNLRVNTALAPIGVNTGTITLSANGLTRNVPVTLEVFPPVKSLSLWPPRLELLDGQSASAPQSVDVRPLLAAPVDFTVESSADWLAAPTGLITAPTRLAFSLRPGRLPLQPVETTVRLIPRDPTHAVVDLSVSFARAVTGWFIVPQIADGGGFRTRLDLFNDSPSPAAVRLDLFRLASRATRSTEPWFPAFDGNPSWQQFSIPPYGMVSLQTLGLSDSPDSGFARIQSSSALSGFAVYRQRQSSGIDQEASVPLLAERVSRLLLPFDQTGGQAAAIALANPCSPSASVLASAVDDQGLTLETSDLGTWPPMGHDAFVLSSVLPATAGRRGTVEFASSQGCVSSIGLRFTPQGAFTSVDPQPPSAAQMLVFPQVADGGGFSTLLVLSNHDTQPAIVTLQFRSSGGETAPSSAWDPGAPSSVLILPGASVTLQSTGLPSSPVSGWAMATSSHRISGFAVFRRRLADSELQEASVAGQSTGTTRSVIPFDNTSGLVTSLAIVNASSVQPLSLNVLARDSSGQPFASAILHLAAGAHAAFELPRRFPETAERQGSIQFSTAAGSFYLLPFRFAPGGAFTSIRSAGK